MIMPCVEAKEYRIGNMITTAGEILDFTVEAGDVLNFENFPDGIVFSSLSVYDESGAKKEDYNAHKGNIVDSYIIKTYEELTGNTLPLGKKCVINFKTSMLSGKAITFAINYSLEDDIKKEIVYQNTYDSVNSNPISYYLGQTDMLLSDLQREGYKFLGWYTSPTFEEDTRITMITKDEPDILTLYAKWEKIEDTSDENSIITNPNTSSMFYIAIGIGIILILGTALVIVYKYKKLDKDE